MDGRTSAWATPALHTDHLDEQGRYELFQILEQESPLQAEPTTVAEHIFLNEETYQPQREKLEMLADRKRHERLAEDESMDWGLVDDELNQMVQGLNHVPDP